MYFIHEFRLIGAEEPFITHCAEQCPSNWKEISYHSPTWGLYRVLFLRKAYPKLLDEKHQKQKEEAVAENEL